MTDKQTNALRSAPQTASHGQAPAVKREFTNELGNSIRITVEGPNSMHENIVTPMEAKQLREALNEHAQKSAPAGATLVHLDHIACIDGGELRYITGRKAPAYDCELYAMPNGGSAPQLYAAPTTQPAPQQAARPVTPYTCPKCHALWLHWPAEQSGFAMDTLNCRSTTHCDYCEKGGVEQLQRLERVPAALAVEMPTPQQEARNLAQALTDRENQPNRYGVEFGMSGTHMHFKIGNQLFKLAYEPDEQEEFDFMKRMLVNAFTTFTHDVNTAPQPSPAAQGDALDAMRYRWLRENWSTMGSTYHDDKMQLYVGRPKYTNITPVDIDVAIDAARAAQEGK